MIIAEADEARLVFLVLEIWHGILSSGISQAVDLCRKSGRLHSVYESIIEDGGVDRRQCKM